MITHDMNLVTRYAARTIVLGLGRVLLDGPTQEVFQQTDQLAKTYIQPPQITQLAQGLSDIGIPNDVMTIEDMARILKGKYQLEV
jgi:energy-coupling factor transport system ATP-binding protein